MRGHDRHVVVAIRVQVLDGDSLAPQFADRAEGLMREQLVAAGMNAGQPRDRQTVVHVRDQGASEGIGEIDRVAGDQLRDGEGFRHRNVADLGEALRPQQVLGYQQRRQAVVRIVGQPDRRGLWRPIGGERSPGAQKPCGPGRRQPGQEMAAIRPDLHESPSIYTAGARRAIWRFRQTPVAPPSRQRHIFILSGRRRGTMTQAGARGKHYRRKSPVGRAVSAPVAQRTIAGRRDDLGGRRHLD